MTRAATLAAAVVAVAGWELAWWARRRQRRGEVYAAALEDARRLGLPLVVVGAPEGGLTAGYGCGDLVIDLGPSSCPVAIRADISQRLPLADSSCVVFVSCVLEYVKDYGSALAELRRISGGRLFVVRVEPWTLTSFAYPGARRTIPSSL